MSGKQEENKLAGKVAALRKELRESRKTCQRLQDENKQLLLEQGYIQQNNENLKSAIRQSITHLQEVVRKLENTKSFLGRSKTIKGIRENVDGVVADLWPLVYIGTRGGPSRYWDGKSETPWPKPIRIPRTAPSIEPPIPWPRPSQRLPKL